MDWLHLETTLVTKLVALLNEHPDSQDRTAFDLAAAMDIPPEIRARCEGVTQRLFHPVSGTPLECATQNGHTDWEASYQAVLASLPDERSRYLALWRRLPEIIRQASHNAPMRPADTCQPNYTAAQALDLAATLDLSSAGGGKGAFLSFQLGPVQSFVAAARSTRDLLSGSILLSWLTHKGMLPVLDRYGPAAIVFPALRGSPLLDRWLAARDGLQDIVSAPPARSPALPNRFLALVPEAEAAELAAAVENSARHAWLDLAESVRVWLDRRWRDSDPNWGSLWNSQIESFFEFRASVLDRSLCEPASTWTSQMQSSARLLEARRMIRHIPGYAPVIDGPVPEKCTLLGTYEQMGPGERSASRRFWERVGARSSGARIGARERLCAVSLVKRFAFAAGLGDELGLDAADVRFPDTATIAASCWLKRAGVDPYGLADNWSGQWLHWPKPDFDSEEDSVPERVWSILRKARKSNGPPPAYFAVLMMDGDHMGRWLAGEKSPRLAEVLHPAARESLSRDAARRQQLEGPANGLMLQAAISEALGNFSQRVAGRIVAAHSGELVYAGGDDVLAFLPLETALAAARELSAAFQGKPGANGGAPPGYYRVDGQDLLMMGERATVSAGLALVHHKEDLRAALQAARDAESFAKSNGRNALAIAAWKRSGEHSVALCPWDWVSAIERQRQLYLANASDRWTYQLRRIQPQLQSLPDDAVHGEVRRLIERSSERQILNADTILGDLRDLREQLAGRSADPLKTFIALSQTASFLARGRDEE